MTTNKNTLSEPNPQKTVNSGLDSAPEEIKLAVDLIFLLESNEIKPDIALKALTIVEQDLHRKIAEQSD